MRSSKVLLLYGFYSRDAHASIYFVPIFKGNLLMKSIFLLVLTLVSLNVLSGCSSTNGGSTNTGSSGVPRGLTPISTQDSGTAAGSRLSAPINTYR